MNRRLSSFESWLGSDGQGPKGTTELRGAEELGGRGHVVFGGCLPAEPRGMMERAMVDGTPREFRDRRDWGEIREWAGEVATELVGAPLS